MYLKLKGIRTTDAGGFKNNYELTMEVNGKVRLYGVSWPDEKIQDQRHRAVLVKDKVVFMTVKATGKNKEIKPISQEDRKRYDLDTSQITPVSSDEFTFIDTGSDAASEEFDRFLEAVRQHMGLVQGWTSQSLI